MSQKPLTPKQQRFVEEYLIDLNATQAAIRTGYSAKTAEVQGCRLLRNAHIARAVAEAMEKRSARTEITADRVLQEYAKLGFANMADYITGDGAMRTLDLSALTRDQAAAIKKIKAKAVMGDAETPSSVMEVEAELHDKKGALDSIAKHLGMFTEKHEHSGPGGAPMEFTRIVFKPVSNGSHEND